MPLELSDMPVIVHIAIDIYNRMGDRYLPGGLDSPPMFIGKDITSLTTLLDIFEVYDPEDKRMILDFIQIMDTHAVKQALSNLKRKKSRK